MIYRKNYMNKTYTHEQYYGQFVTRYIKDLIRTNIGTDRIRSSRCPAFNNIPLREWDSFHPLIVALQGRNISLANGNGRPGGVSLSDTGCIAKEAARQIREEETNS